MIYTPPSNIGLRDFSKKSVFLAGSIEMGAAEDWQTETAIALDPEYNVFNPRRVDWDSSWKQEYTNAQFSQQVNWELGALEAANYIIMYFDPSTKSPISLLELGLYAESTKLMVVCPKGFWRKGNVDIVCERYNIPQFDNLYTVRSILHKLID